MKESLIGQQVVAGFLIRRDRQARSTRRQRRRQGSCCHPAGTQQAACFRTRLVKLTLGNLIHDDAGTSLRLDRGDVIRIAFHHQEFRVWNFLLVGFDRCGRLHRVASGRDGQRRREGDPAGLVANSDKLQQALGWKPRYADLRENVATAWNFEQRHTAVR